MYRVSDCTQRNLSLQVWLAPPISRIGRSRSRALQRFTWWSGSDPHRPERAFNATPAPTERRAKSFFHDGKVLSPVQLMLAGRNTIAKETKLIGCEQACEKTNGLRRAHWEIEIWPAVRFQSCVFVVVIIAPSSIFVFVRCLTVVVRCRFHVHYWFTAPSHHIERNRSTSHANFRINLLTMCKFPRTA